MKALEQKKWTNGKNKQFNLLKIEKIISTHSKEKKKIFIGSDSFVSQGKITFVTAVCLLTPGFGGKYYFYKDKVLDRRYKTLSSRITEEVRRSIELAEHFMENLSLNPGLIELHLDVSPFSARNGTSKFSDMLKGYVQGYGFECKLKPYAWASQSVADRHSK